MMAIKTALWVPTLWRSHRRNRRLLIGTLCFLPVILPRTVTVHFSIYSPSGQLNAIIGINEAEDLCQYICLPSNLDAYRLYVASIIYQENALTFIWDRKSFTVRTSLFGIDTKTTLFLHPCHGGRKFDRKLQFWLFEQDSEAKSYRPL